VASPTGTYITYMYYVLNPPPMPYVYAIQICIKPNYLSGIYTSYTSCTSYPPDQSTSTRAPPPHTTIGMYVYMCMCICICICICVCIMVLTPSFHIYTYSTMSIYHYILHTTIGPSSTRTTPDTPSSSCSSASSGHQVCVYVYVRVCVCMTYINVIKPTYCTIYV
jgi:hypothetical protein